VTISLGAAVLLESDKLASDIIKRADEKLYVAKRSGRNKLCS
jgi:two-component system, cell cycle response regulator